MLFETKSSDRRSDDVAEYTPVSHLRNTNYKKIHPWLSPKFKKLSSPPPQVFRNDLPITPILHIVALLIWSDFSSKFSPAAANHHSHNPSVSRLAICKSDDTHSNNNQTIFRRTEVVLEMRTAHCHKCQAGNTHIKQRETKKQETGHPLGCNK